MSALDQWQNLFWQVTYSFRKTCVEHIISGPPDGVWTSFGTPGLRQKEEKVPSAQSFFLTGRIWAPNIRAILLLTGFGPGEAGSRLTD